MKTSRLFWNLAAATALLYLVAMVISGALPQQRQLVKAEAGGVMSTTPEHITRVKIEAAGKSFAFARRDAGWTQEGKGQLPQAQAEKLSLAVQVMHTSAPVRVLEPEEYRGTDLREFGLDAPALSISLYDDAAPILQAHFGGLNPDKYLRYMTVDGRQQLFLMSLFIQDEWTAVVANASAK